MAGVQALEEKIYNVQPGSDRFHREDMHDGRVCTDNSNGIFMAKHSAGDDAVDNPMRPCKNNISFCRLGKNKN